jgi:tetratricopeptide (TPR) repeat protein
MLKLNKKISIYLLFGFLVMILSGCSARIEKSQLQFGIESAQRNLWDEAIFRWKKVLQSDPGSAAAHNNLAVAYEKKGLWEEAKKEYLAALKLKPNDDHIQGPARQAKTLSSGSRFLRKESSLWILSMKSSSLTLS